jgi:hypothetical protein
LSQKRCGVIDSAVVHFCWCASNKEAGASAAALSQANKSGLVGSNRYGKTKTATSRPIERRAVTVNALAGFCADRE